MENILKCNLNVIKFNKFPRMIQPDTDVFLRKSVIEDCVNFSHVNLD